MLLLINLRWCGHGLDGFDHKGAHFRWQLGVDYPHVVLVLEVNQLALVFLLSLRLRRREIETLFKIGGSRAAVGTVMVFEVVVVLLTSVVLAAGLTLLTREFGSAAIRAFIRM